MTLTGAEAARIRRFFTNFLWVRQEATFYWLPGSRRVIARASGVDPKGRRPLPRAAVLIGAFRYPCDPFNFMDDLNDALRRLDNDRP